MPSGCDQATKLDEGSTHSEHSRDRGASNPQRESSVETKMTVHLQYERETDTMYVDLCETPADAKVDVFEAGEQLGFPGQLFVRVDVERQIMFGVTIQNFSSFKRRIMWRYRIASVQRALELLVASLRAGLIIDRPRQMHLPAF